MRKQNKQQVLMSIFKKKECTREQLASETKLSLSTLSYILRELVEEQLITVIAIPQSRGRPILMYRLKSDAWFSIGVKVGREEVRGALFNPLMQTVRTYAVRIMANMRNNTGYLSALKQVIENLKCKNLLCVGICSSGIVDENSIVVSHLMNVRNLNVAELLLQLGVENFVLMNDVDALSYAISDMGESDFLTLTYGTGIGASFYKFGKAQHIEIGHSIVSTEGKCYCGQVGCLEYHSSEYAVLKAFLKEDFSFEDFAANEEEKYRDKINELRKISRKNFEKVKDLYEPALRLLSFVVGNLLLILKPSKVFFLGEGLTNAQMVELVRSHVETKFNKEFINSVTFKTVDASWEFGVALASIHKFLRKLIR